jgi:toxin ParE1/3/4
MTVAKVHLRALARQDVEQAVDFYILEQAPQSAFDFIGEVERAFTHLAQFPATGSPRYAHELGLPGLRSWSLGRFPYTVFYMDQNGEVDVWRVLHQRTDIPQWLREQ